MTKDIRPVFHTPCSVSSPNSLQRVGWFCVRVKADLNELSRRMVFNILVTNDNDHLRNHGFLSDSKGWRLSPLSDVVPKPQVGLERRLVLGVGLKGRLATLTNALAGAAHFNLDQDEARVLVDRMADHVHARWKNCFIGAGIGDRPRASRPASDKPTRRCAGKQRIS